MAVDVNHEERVAATFLATGEKQGFPTLKMFFEEFQRQSVGANHRLPWRKLTVLTLQLTWTGWYACSRSSHSRDPQSMAFASIMSHLAGSTIGSLRRTDFRYNVLCAIRVPRIETKRPQGKRNRLGSGSNHYLRSFVFCVNLTLPQPSI